MRTRWPWWRYRRRPRRRSSDRRGPGAASSQSSIAFLLSRWKTSGYSGHVLWFGPGAILLLLDYFVNIFGNGSASSAARTAIFDHDDNHILRIFEGRIRGEPGDVTNQMGLGILHLRCSRLAANSHAGHEGRFSGAFF